eukprot:CFRG7665T1
MNNEEYQVVLKATVDFCKELLKDNDASHDYSHADRVRNVAIKLGRGESLNQTSMQIVEISALLHDVDDWKYCPEDKGELSRTREFLKQQEFPHSDVVLRIVKSMGFKESLNNKDQNQFVEPELAVVQDADRLDAIGAVGVARCLTFGGRFNRVLYDPNIAPRVNMTKEQYQNQTAQQTTINHFHEKLFLLKDMMKTDTGRQIANERHLFMEQFVDQLMAEMKGER